jgi:O-antigen ligase
MLNYLTPVEVVPALAPYRVMLWILPVAVIGSVPSLATGGFTFRVPQFHLLLAFGGAAVFSIVVALGWFGGAFMAAMDFLLIIVAVCVLMLSVTSFSRMRKLIGVLLLTSLYMAVECFAAYHANHRASELLIYEGAVDEEGQPLPEAQARIRAFGYLADPNDLAQHFIICVALSRGLWKRKHTLWNFIVVLLPSAAFLYGVLLTRSRGGLLGLAVLIGLTARERLGKVSTALLTGVVLVGLIAFNVTGGKEISGSEGSAAGRIEAWAAGIAMLKASPFAGVGYRFFLDHHERTAHNAFVLCFAELGLIGFTIWMTLLVFTLMELSSVIKHATAEEDWELRRWANLIRTALLTFLATSWFLSRTYVLTPYILIALAVAVAGRARRRNLPIMEFGMRPVAYSVLAEFAALVAVYLTCRFRGFI